MLPQDKCVWFYKLTTAAVRGLPKISSLQRGKGNGRGVHISTGSGAEWQAGIIARASGCSDALTKAERLQVFDTQKSSTPVKGTMHGGSGSV